MGKNVFVLPGNGNALVFTSDLSDLLLLKQTLRFHRAVFFEEEKIKKSQPDVFLVTSPHEQRTLVLHLLVIEIPRSAFRLLSLHRQFGLKLMLIGEATLLKDTAGTCGAFRRTVKCTKFHYCLIMQIRMVVTDYLVSECC